ncbi:hypothetical protein CN074_27450 [Sinorhizobium medicae]|nr:hypothetical protein CN201_13110 [Sinorhizobium medicae]RVP62456.1 hypothetical protein CN074_27450 [Sinorhizobium medicae]
MAALKKLARNRAHGRDVSVPEGFSGCELEPGSSESTIGISDVRSGSLEWNRVIEPQFFDEHVAIGAAVGRPLQLCLFQRTRRAVTLQSELSTTRLAGLVLPGTAHQDRTQKPGCRT